MTEEQKKHLYRQILTEEMMKFVSEPGTQREIIKRAEKRLKQMQEKNESAEKVKKLD